MNLRGVVLVVLVFLTLAAYGQQNRKAQRQAEKTAEFRQLQALVQSGAYEFIGRFALPQSGRQVDLLARPNYLRLNGARAEARLPYFGVAYGSSFGAADAGIVFSGTMADFQQEVNEQKRQLLVFFRVDDFTCRLTIAGKDNVLLAVTSTNRQPISYRGRIRALDTIKDN